jgi:hypothetical protein
MTVSDREAFDPAIAASLAPRGHRSEAWLRRRLAAGIRGFFGAFLGALREHLLLLAVVGLYVAIGSRLLLAWGRPLEFMFSVGAVATTLWMIGLWVVILLFIVELVIAARRGGRILPRVWRRISTQYLRADRLWSGLLALVLFTIFAHSFAAVKALIPFLHKLDWDPTLAAWDRWLHFGRSPWQWLQPIFGHPPVTSAMSVVYASWFFVLYGVMLWQAFSQRDPVLRMRYLLVTVLVWILLGNVLAIQFASGGPIYYGRLTGEPDPYAAQVAYLQAAAKLWPNFALSAQEFLWQLYLENGKEGRLTACISAMPSLHVASSCSLFLLARATHRRLGIAFGAFLLLILLGSVHLGWHYAIDGYVGIVLTLLLWWGCGRLLLWRPVGRLLWGASGPVPVPLQPIRD